MMDYMWKKMRELKSKDSGFTLIELLIVILILGILAGIAIFSYQGFAARASAACEDANDRMDLIAQAANEIDPSIAVYHADGEPDCSGAGGPSTPADPGETFTVTSGHQTLHTNPAAFTDVVPAGQLMVVYSAVLDPGNTDPSLSSTGGTGWTRRQVVVAGDRAGAVWTKVSTGAAETVTVDWGGQTAITNERWAFAKNGAINSPWAEQVRAYSVSGVTPPGSAQSVLGFQESGLVFVTNVAPAGTTTGVTVASAPFGPHAGGPLGGTAANGRYFANTTGVATGSPLSITHQWDTHAEPRGVIVLVVR